MFRGWAEVKVLNKGCDREVGLDAEEAVSLAKLNNTFYIKDEPRKDFE